MTALLRERVLRECVADAVLEALENGDIVGGEAAWGGHLPPHHVVVVDNSSRLPTRTTAMAQARVLSCRQDVRRRPRTRALASPPCPQQQLSTSSR